MATNAVRRGKVAANDKIVLGLNEAARLNNIRPWPLVDDDQIPED